MKPAAVDSKTIIDPTIPSGVGFWRRTGARLLDYLPHYTATFMALLPAAIILGIYCGITNKPFQEIWSKVNPSNFLWFFFALTGSIAYHAISEGLHGATLGKLIFRIKVISSDNTACNIKQAIGRSAAYYVDSLFFGVIAASNMSESRLRQRLGDNWNKTIVCRNRDLEIHHQRSAWRFVWVFALAFSVNTLIQSIGLVLHVL